MFSFSFLDHSAQALSPLNEYIRHYEPLSYDHKAPPTLTRSRRAADLYSDEHYHEDQQNPLYSIDFNAHGRSFSLRLKRDTTSSVFHPDLVIEDGDGKPLSVSLDHLVSGHLADQPNSVAFGSLRNGVFEGRIHSTVPKPAIFYVERAHKYFAEAEPTSIYLLSSPERLNKTHSTNYNLYDLVNSVKLGATSSPAPQKLPLPFHSVIYASNVVDAHRPKRNLFGKCDKHVCSFLFCLLSLLCNYILSFYLFTPSSHVAPSFILFFSLDVLSRGLLTVFALPPTSFQSD